ncbi:hypothetical protein [Bacillus thermotolerans]|uniref:hypothetical protein n=1 Tax=Bacillus thermotolerans TaxID=1221996 RepID=UPI00058911B1|nr:hypothetical protein [Bacillus thermotolerans]KKB34097.1 hypothetical protein QY96_00272 [Bacillus thermotolerans]
MRMFLKSFSIFCLIFMSLSANTNANSTTIDAGTFEQVTGEKEIKAAEKLVKTDKKKLEKQFKEDKIEFYEPGVFLYPESDVTAVIYKIKSDRVSIDSELSHAIFTIADEDASTVTSQLLKVEDLEDGLKQVIMLQNEVVTGDYIVRSSDNAFVSGWMTNEFGKKVDVASDSFQQSFNAYLDTTTAPGSSCGEEATFGITSFSSCLDRCLDNSAVPKWLSYTIITVAGVSCVFGPNPVCVTALSQVAALWTSDAIRCVSRCA